MLTGAFLFFFFVLFLNEQNIIVLLPTPIHLNHGSSTFVRVTVSSSTSPQEIQRLSVQLKDKDQELERLRCQPDHEKDLEIHRLRSMLEERESAEATRAVLCTSLAEEADQMRSQLGATVKVCQELLARLENEKKGGDGQEALSSQQNSKEVSVCLLPCASY